MANQIPCTGCGRAGIAVAATATRAGTAQARGYIVSISMTVGIGQNA